MKIAKKLWVISMAVLLSCALLPIHIAQASTTVSSPKVLVAYTTATGKITPTVRVLEMLIGHFTTHVTFENAAAVKPADLDKANYLIYIGANQQALPSTFRSDVTKFSGSVVAIGYNVSELGSRFSFMDGSSQVVVNHLELPSKHASISLKDSILLQDVRLLKSATVLETAAGKSFHGPLLVQHNHDYYFATSNLLTAKVSIFLAQGLNDIFHAQPTPVHPAYLRLEDVSPNEDPVSLLAIGKYLYSQHIPYMISTIPVFVDPKTHTVLRFDDRPKVLKALLWMQNHGATILLHGYTHQYGDEITGLGADFWDQKDNMPIISPAGAPKKTRKDFPNNASYLNYLKQGMPYEITYMNTILRKGVQELVTVGLHPVAFEAPHYEMSLEGYGVVAKDFSTYIGQAQLSDLNWHVMTTCPYISHPSFMHGMLFLPETIGYVEQNNPDAVSQMMQNAKMYEIVNDSIISGFYHPYLGLAKLKKVVQGMEQIPGIQWINLKAMNNTVHVQDVTINSSQQGVVVKADLLLTRYFWIARFKAVEHALYWIIPILFPVIAIITIVLEKWRKKRRRRTEV